MEVTSANPITAFQIELQMAHRIVAVLTLVGIAVCAWLAVRGFTLNHPVAQWTMAWLGLIVAQFTLGAATVLTNKAADVATAHVLVGALALAVGVILFIISSCNRAATVLSEDRSSAAAATGFAPRIATTR
jgi:cytochrome c oxidase assembly protein subunit 15